MKNKTKELDVDFIGGQEFLTKEEELMINKFIESQKKKRDRSSLRKKKAKQNT